MPAFIFDATKHTPSANFEDDGPPNSEWPDEVEGNDIAPPILIEGNPSPESWVEKQFKEGAPPNSEDTPSVTLPWSTFKDETLPYSDFVFTEDGAVSIETLEKLRDESGENVYIQQAGRIDRSAKFGTKEEYDDKFAKFKAERLQVSGTITAHFPSEEVLEEFKKGEIESQERIAGMLPPWFKPDPTQPEPREQKSDDVVTQEFKLPSDKPAEPPAKKRPGRPTNDSKLKKKTEKELEFKERYDAYLKECQDRNSYIDKLAASIKALSVERQSVMHDYDKRIAEAKLELAKVKALPKPVPPIKNT